MTVLQEVYADAALVVAEYLSKETTKVGASLLFSKIEDRVYIDSLPKGLIPAGCVVAKQVGGKARVGLPLQNARMELDCYGADDSPEAAREIARLVTAQLHRARADETTSGYVLTAVADGGGTTIWTPPNVRPFVPVYASVLVQAKESE